MPKRRRTRWKRSAYASHFRHGRRVQTTKTSDGKQNFPLYSLDGKLILEDNRQTLQRIEYIYAGGRLVANKIQPITAAGANNGTATTTTIHTDFLGSPVVETNASGTVTRVERYTPYGEPSDMQLDAGPGFTGHATDVATGLTYMQQRYYDPDIIRFPVPDPVGPEEDFIKHFNRYNYAQNNPVRYTDPDGRSALSLAIKFIAKGGDAAATFAGVIDDANTVMDSNASTGDRFLAGISILSEAAPVSLRDGKAVVNVGKGIVNKATGAYTNTHKTGTKYHGKGSEDRMAKSASNKAAENKDPVQKMEHTPTENSREAFKEEARRIEADGGPGKGNYNKINSPGSKYIREDKPNK